MTIPSGSHEAAGSAAGVVEIESGGPGQTRRLGAQLGALLAAGDVVLLSGPLGAGKTALTQGIGQGLGVSATINSPTFTLLKEYRGRLPLYHFDLYRIDDPDELYALGFDDYFAGEGVSVIEWAERGQTSAPDAPSDAPDADPWPPSWLRIELRIAGPERRVLRCTASGARGATLLAALAQAARDGQP